MPPVPASSPAKATSQISEYSSRAVVLKSLLATGILLAAILGGLDASGRTNILSFFRHGNDLTDAQIQERLAAFNVLGEMALDVVQDKDVPQAVESMQLPPAEKEALLDSMKEPASETTPSPAPAKEAAFKKERRRLVWVSIWDTNTDNGNVVRIDSQGYSRFVTLRKQPIVFAVPTSPDGRWIIHVTGISDIDGRGITIGLASGKAKAIFPLMRARQDLGLKVKVD